MNICTSIFFLSEDSCKRYVHNNENNVIMMYNFSPHYMLIVFDFQRIYVFPLNSLLSCFESISFYSTQTTGNIASIVYKAVTLELFSLSHRGESNL